MKKSYLLLFALFLFGLSACSHSTCPTYSQNTGEMKYKSNKTKSGIYPKNMK